MALGIRLFFTQTAALAVTSSIVPVATNLVCPVAVGQRVNGRLVLPVTVGATGGIRIQMTGPAAPASFTNSIILANVPGTTFIGATQTALGSFTNALANAGQSFVYMDFSFVNGVTAGNLTVLFAQNTSDALTATLMLGASMDVCIQNS